MASNAEIEAGLKEILWQHGQDNSSAESGSKGQEKSRKQRPNSRQKRSKNTDRPPPEKKCGEDPKFVQERATIKQSRPRPTRQNIQTHVSPSASDTKFSQNKKSCDDPRNRDPKKQRIRKQRSRGEENSAEVNRRVISGQKNEPEYKDINSTSPSSKKKRKKKKKKPVNIKGEDNERAESTPSSKNIASTPNEADKKPAVGQDLESPHEPTGVLEELSAEYIYPLKKRSSKFPSARFFCRLCEYHCDTEAVCRKHMKDTRHKRLRMIKTTDILLRSLPPPTEAHMAALDQLTERVYAQHALSEEQLSARHCVADRVAELVKDKFPEASVQLSVYGTTATRFGLQDSDLNLDLMAEDAAKVLANLHLILKDDQSGYFSEVKSDFGAKVPSVLFKVTECSLKCQLGVNSGSASQTTRLLTAYSNIDPRVKKLAVVFRYWARLCKVDCQDAGTLPPYAFAIMTVYFLQQCSPPVLPVFEELSKSDAKSSESTFFDNLEKLGTAWQTKNDWSLGELWVRLLKFYAISLDISCMVICIRQHRPLTRDEKKWASKKLAIEDPFARKRNIARSVSHSHVFEYIYDRLRAAYLYYGVPQTREGPLLDKVDTSGLEHQLQENLKKLNESPISPVRALPGSGTGKEELGASRDVKNVLESPSVEKKVVETLPVDKVVESPSVDKVMESASIKKVVESPSVDKKVVESPSVDKKIVESTSVDKKIVESTSVGKVMETLSVDKKALESSHKKVVECSSVDKEAKESNTMTRNDVKTPSYGKMGVQSSSVEVMDTSSVSESVVDGRMAVEVLSEDIIVTTPTGLTIPKISADDSIEMEESIMKATANEKPTQHPMDNAANEQSATMAFANSLVDDVLTEAMADIGISVVSAASSVITRLHSPSPVDGGLELSESELEDAEALSSDEELEDATTANAGACVVAVANENVELEDGEAVKTAKDVLEDSEKEGDDEEEEVTDEDSDAYEDAKEDVEEETTDANTSSQSCTSTTDKSQSGQLSYNQELLSTLSAEDYIFHFNEETLSDGKGPAIMCSICQQEGHLKQNCPEERLPDLEPLPPLTPGYRTLLDKIIMQVPRDFEPKLSELKMRNDVLLEIEAFIQQTYSSAKLTLFGSSCNGFGFGHSDLDICMTLEQETSEGIDCIEIIETLAGRLRKHRSLYNVLAITTAKVPIVKFRHRRSQLEGDISLYNTLAQHNTRMLQLYSEADPRVKALGYTMKVFGKLCNICDASRGSLSSYAYIIIVLYFLQQRRPPVIPVLQEVYNGDKPELIVEGWNAWYYNSIKNLCKDWPQHGKNKETVGELWLGLLRFYTEEFNFRDYVISVRQHKPLTRFEKLWNGKCVAIEDPFDMSHNLGAGVSRKMNMYIMKALRNGRKVFGTPVTQTPHGYTSLSDYLFDPQLLTEGEPPNDRGCRACGKIGHFAKECPVVLARKERNERERERRKEERDHGDEEPGRGRPQRHDPEPRHNNDNRRTRDNQDNRQHNQNKGNYQGSSPKPIPGGRSYNTGGGHQHVSPHGDPHSPYSSGHAYGTTPYGSASPRMATSSGNIGAQVFYNSGMRDDSGGHMGSSPYSGRNQQRSVYQMNTTSVDMRSPQRSTTGVLGSRPPGVGSTNNRSPNKVYTKWHRQFNAFSHGNQWD